ncbi:30S ribosomal protein S4 [Candidatus Uhrbacteria bacterium CG_4_9_14_0_2_um_filter_41_50]|uniref:Small ribosomal subunit protein uS4 n=1 Tax=Candidatus Uhrbacteria bacterium CG_4_9_14_0_2_um_filter_41_50 TaxID=1975031 RepID=A0A2M8EPX0_9BACT|nr:MAG: 30S ribosomal protein S4 [Candidatus Uhrbacteria bacterium CG_4_10_14_3_um_filter_41_21]PIZ54640.1 MAG: 30S ribosomal protein S4 [Candidatus Uhrbacteria bacterium CG_4_10_14_0_2_um_filter_41_21]PJB84659.1 MAG: 30S ribosomal protein S4 [Candidatus Uhrbacteria bacterium CG_4_9_14_0_8_um_filter_41_16]PJC24790.1 MAG: 30S ribosomal protein S4 [Candidatus Uhrbacteria bacterium CG_4_9_14_0_2_um_filter_41_50]PJE75133.1 MAG: 30S ribosomal protein S4 [Candidatus Uhrbacteria bacterium CG10_big_fil
MGKTLKKMGKMSRREGVPLSTSAKVLKVIQKRPYAPGVHGSIQGSKGKRTRLSVYGIQLREKQKAKRLYGIMEKQFRNYFAKATSMPGNSAENLAVMLETRLDNAVYRLGIAKTRPQARQMVSHAMFTVNGRKVNIPSYKVKVDDVVAVRDNKQAKKIFDDFSEQIGNHNVPGWLHLDAATKSGKVVGLPEGEDLKEVYDPKLIVEFYSR